MSILTTPNDLPSQRSKTESPLEIHKKRFVIGEITRIEIEKKIVGGKLNKKNTRKQVILRFSNHCFC